MRPLDPPSDLEIPPGEDELPYDDGEPLETNRHRLQMTLLAGLLDRDLAARRSDYFVGANMFLYYSILQTRKNDFRGPDVFVALGVERRDRKSWVIWGEDGKAPDVIVELTSESTAAEDRGKKKRVYEMLHVPEYYVYDPITGDFEGYQLDVNAYRQLTPTSEGRLESRALGLELGVWGGAYYGFEGPWLRCWRDGQLVPLAEESEREERRLREDAERLRDEERRLRDEEQRRREEAERKLAAAMAELARLRGE